MLSALQHYAFCSRQCALLHTEMIWLENGLTAEGRLLHENVHAEDSYMRDGVKIVTNLELRSFRLELHGRADVVEFHQKNGGIWQPYPIEYKKGNIKKDCDADIVQLCGQALCLEEMLHTNITEGALYYAKPKRRHKVIFDDALRERTKQIITDVKKMLESNTTPPPPRDCKGCDACSVNSMCMPAVFKRRASDYIKEMCGDWS